MPKLLRLVRTTAVSSVAYFKVDDNVLNKANVRRSCVGENFENLFLGTIEKDAQESNIVCFELFSKSLDEIILQQFGEKKSVSLSHFFELINLQDKGEKGILAVTGKPNIIYVPDKGGKLWAVYACYYPEGSFWRIDASRITHPAGWNPGCRVLRYVK